jgi:CheY-like chemotaxis protein
LHKAAKRVAVIEDDRIAAMAMEACLAGAGHQVVGTAECRAEALELARAERPDLALVDIRLAHGDSGLDVAADLARLGVPVIYVTAKCPVEPGQGIVLGCLHKPVAEAALLAAVGVANVMLHGGAPTRLPIRMHRY